MATPGQGGKGRSWFAVEVTSEPVAPGSTPWPEPGTPTPDVVLPTLRTGGGHPLTHGGGGPLFEPGEFEQKISSTIEISLPAFSQTVGGKISAIRDFDMAIPVEVAMVKEFELRLAGARESSQRWGNLLREDEELLLMI